MKTLPVVVFALLPLVAGAVEQRSLAFPDQKIGLPALSLAEIGQTGSADLLHEAGAWFRSQGPVVAPARKLVSNMPVLTIKRDLDSKMVRSVDSSIDYKLIIQAPNVESTK